MKKVAKLLVMIVLFASLAGCAKKPSITVPSGVLEFTVGDKDFTSENTEEKLLVGVTAVDNDNGKEAALKVSDFGGFDINKIGEYTITVEATSGAKKSVTETRQVKVVDRSLPVLNVPNGILEFYEKDETFTSENISEKLLEGVTVTDAVDDNIQPDVSDLGGFDIAIPGEYAITITATNTGNKTVTETRAVKVITRPDPEILIPDEEVVLETGVILTPEQVIEALKDGGLVANDEFDANPVIEIENFDSLDFSTEGQYTLNIVVTNKYGKTAEADVYITVYQNRTPEILSTGIMVMNKISISEFDEEAFLEEFKKGILVKDDKGTYDIADDGAIEIDGNIVDVNGDFSPSVKGVYTFEFTVTDDRGLKATGSKLIKVVEPQDRVLATGDQAFEIASESNYSLNSTVDPNNYQVAVYTSRGKTEMSVPASGYAWLLNGNHEIVQILSGDEFLANLVMNEDDLLFVFGKEDSKSWAVSNGQLAGEILIYNIDIYELLDAPVVTKLVDTLSWSPVEGATGYQIYLNSEPYALIQETSFDLTTVVGITQEENQFIVKALNNINRSLPSNEVAHTYSSEAGIVDITTMWFEKDGFRNDDEGDVLVWDGVENALQYRIYVNGMQIAVVNATAGTIKYQYDIKNGNNSWRKIPETINYVDKDGNSYPLLDNNGLPMQDAEGNPILRPISIQTYDSYEFNFTVEALVPNAVITPSDPIAFEVRRIEQPLLIASKYEAGHDDAYDGDALLELEPNPNFIPGGLFEATPFNQRLLYNDSLIMISKSGMEKMTGLSYIVNGSLEIMRLNPAYISYLESNQVLVSLDQGMPNVGINEPVYVTSLSMLTMPESALTALAQLKAGALVPDPEVVYCEPGDFFGVSFNPLFLQDLALGNQNSTQFKFIVKDTAGGQSGWSVWSQLIFRGDNARWYDSLPSQRMILTVPGKDDSTNPAIMMFAPGNWEII